MLFIVLCVLSSVLSAQAVMLSRAQAQDSQSFQSSGEDILNNHANK